MWPRNLAEAALCRSHTLKPAREGFNDIMPTIEDMQRLVKDPVAYRYEHEDGLKSTMLLMSGLVSDFNFAAQLDKGIVSTQMYLPMPDGRTTLANFFSPLGKRHGADVPDRKANLSCRENIADHRTDCGRRRKPIPRQTKYETPHLAIRYQPTRESTFWRS